MSRKLLFACIIVASLSLTAILIAQNRFPKNPGESISTAEAFPTGNVESPHLDVPSCTGKLTLSQTEGPYYKPGSPEIKNISEGIEGEKLTVSGYVFNRYCTPMPNVRVDFWQADSKGTYDAAGFNLRGHQFTDSTGRYELTTIVPMAYENRSSHIHVKLKSSHFTLTSQLYFPDESKNLKDNIFNPELLMDVEDTEIGKVGIFNFVIPE